MQKLLIIGLCFLSSLSLHADSQNLKKELRTQKAINQALKQEKKFAKEQKFYRYNEYDFKGSEVNEESLKSIQKIEPEDDFDMTHVYD